MQLYYNQDTQLLTIHTSTQNEHNVIFRIGGGSLSLPTKLVELNLHPSFDDCQDMIRAWKSQTGIPLHGKLKDCVEWMLNNPQTVRKTILDYNHIAGEKLDDIDNVFRTLRLQFYQAISQQTLGEYLKERDNAA